MALPRYVEGARNGVVPWVSPIAGSEALATTRKIGPSQRRHIRIAVR